MEVLFDETYTCPGVPIVSRNIWYGFADVYVDEEYGKDIQLGEDLMEELRSIIKNNLSETFTPAPTETHWYFYGKETAQDAIGDNIRPTIMVREKDGLFTINFNISDHDFAVNIDKILLFKENLEKCLSGDL